MKKSWNNHILRNNWVVLNQSLFQLTLIRLSFDCLQQQFYQDERFSLIYARSGRCIQPYLGSKDPIIGTRLVTNERSDADIAQFKFIFGKTERYFNSNLHDIVWIQEASTVTKSMIVTGPKPVVRVGGAECPPGDHLSENVALLSEFS